MQLNCDGIFDNDFIVNSLMNLLVK